MKKMKRDVIRPRIVTAVALALGLMGSSLVSAQTGGSALVGSVKDATGGALPGVTVTAESPALIARVKAAVTDGKGAYQIIDLRPGTYTVSFALQGFKSVKNEGIVLTTSFTATVNAVLPVGAMEELVTVTGTSPLIDVRSGDSGRALTLELLEGIPVGRNIYQVGQFMPGAAMNRPDVGGSETAQSTRISIHGSAQNDVTWNANGLEISGNNGDGGPTTTYYNQGFNEEIVFTSTALPAEVGAGGVSVNMVKKEGSNAFRGDLHVSATGSGLQSNNVSEEQRQLGLLVPGRMDRASDINGTLGGPVLRDKLWFAGSYRRWRIDRFAANTFNLDGSQAIDDQLLQNYSTSLTWQVSKKNRVSGFVEFLDKLRGHRRDRASTYQFISPEASYYQPNNGPSGTLKWTSTIRDNFLLEAGFSLMHVWWSTIQQPDLPAGALPRNDILLSTLTGAPVTLLLREDDWRRTGTLVVSWLPSWKGSHKIRVGGTYGNGPVVQDRASVGGRDLVARYRNGVPDSVTVYNTPVRSSVTMFDHSIFVQDSWTIEDRLTINAGARAEFLRQRVDEQTAPAGTFVPARHFAEIDNVPNWKTVVPRLAFAYDLFGNGKTALRLNTSKYMNRQQTGLSLSINPLRLNSEVRSWRDNGDGVPQLAEIGPSLGGLERGATVQLDPTLRRPYQWEFTVSLSHQLTSTLAVTVGYYRRKYSDMYSTVNTALQPSDYLPVTITNPLTGQPFTVYNQNPATVGRITSVVRNSDTLGSKYNGFDVTVDKRMSKNFMVFGGFTVSANKQCSSGAASTNPNDAINACGYAALDSKFTTNFSGVYRLPRDFNVSGHFYYATGQPLNRTFIVTRAIVPSLTQVNQTVVLVPSGDVRKPSWSLLDLRLSKVFRFGRKMQFEPVVDFYNLLNENAAIAEVTTVGPALGRISENIDGRLVRFGAKFSF